MKNKHLNNAWLCLIIIATVVCMGSATSTQQQICGSGSGSGGVPPKCHDVSTDTNDDNIGPQFTTDDETENEKGENETCPPGHHYVPDDDDDKTENKKEIEKEREPSQFVTTLKQSILTSQQSALLTKEVLQEQAQRLIDDVVALKMDPNHQEPENIFYIGTELPVPGVLKSSQGFSADLSDEHRNVFKVIMQPDCNLVLYAFGLTADHAIWQSHTAGIDRDCDLYVNSDWTMDIRTHNGLKVWSTGIQNAYLDIKPTVLRIMSLRNDKIDLRLVFLGVNNKGIGNGQDKTLVIR